MLRSSSANLDCTICVSVSIAFVFNLNLTRQLLAFASSSPSTLLSAVRSTNSNRSRPHRSASRHLDDSCSSHHNKIRNHTHTNFFDFSLFFNSRQLSLSLSALAIDLSQNRDSRNKEKKQIIFHWLAELKVNKSRKNRNSGRTNNVESFEWEKSTWKASRENWAAHRKAQRMYGPREGGRVCRVVCD